MKKRVVFGFLGSTLDQGRGRNSNRWDRWRPTISACWQTDLPIDRYIIFYSKKYERLLKLILKDIEEISPKTEVIAHLMELKDPWDFEEVYTLLFDFAKQYKFKLDKEDYLVNITTGTHVAQINSFKFLQPLKWKTELKEDIGLLT